jgi:uncharacterized protein
MAGNHMGDCDMNVKRIFPDKFDLDKGIYRSSMKYTEKYNWRIVYKYSDLIISCNRDVIGKIRSLLIEAYDLLESFIGKEPYFGKSLSPIEVKDNYPPIVKKMCQKAEVFNIGPMATVAGAICDYIASGLRGQYSRLIIENGGDVFIKSNKDVDVGVYVKSKIFRDRIYLKIRSKDTPCGLCSSSGIFGHSLSMGRADLVMVLSGSTISADGAATSIANRIEKDADIESIIELYEEKKEIKGILIVKGEDIGIWGKIELAGG